MQAKQRYGGRVTALTMGPESSQKVLKTAFSIGADRGVLLSDHAFAGADVYATAYTLAQGIQRLGSFDLIVCGQHSSDGDTAQLPFSLAAQLKIPALGWVKSIDFREGYLVLRQELSSGTQQAEVSFPCLIAAGSGIGIPRIPSLRSQLTARGKKPEILTLAELPDQNPEHYGLLGSRTRVIKVQDILKWQKHNPLMLNGEEGARELLKLCREVKTYG